jgi:hypothetical protein
MRSALTGRHHDILEVLVRLPNNDSRREAIKSAASSINWRTDVAADQFLRRLSRTSARSGHRRTAHGRTATHER